MERTKLAIALSFVVTSPTICSAPAAAQSVRTGVGVALFSSGFRGRVSANEVEWRGNVRVENSTRTPICNPKVAVTFSYGGHRAPIVKGVVLSQFQSAGNMTQNVLLAYWKSRPTRVTIRIPVDAWRNDTEVTVAFAGADAFKTQGDLHDPMRLMAFIYAGTTQEVVAAIKRDPSLMKVRLKNGGSPMMMSLLQQDPAMTSALEKLGGSLQEVTPAGHCALHFAAMSSPQMASYVAGRHIQSRLTNESKLSPLHYAVEMGDIGTIPILIKAGVSPNTKNASGLTPLMEAVLEYQPELARALKKGGATLAAFDEQGYSAMALAAMQSPKSLNQVLALGGDVNLRDPKTGITPLHAAVQACNFDCARWLLKHGAKTSAKDDHGEVPLDYVNRYQYPPYRQQMTAILTGKE